LSEVHKSFDGQDRQDRQEKWEGGWLAQLSDRGSPRQLEVVVAEGFFGALYAQV
jgi:hypothetical protein